MKFEDLKKNDIFMYSWIDSTGKYCDFISIVTKVTDRYLICSDKISLSDNRILLNSIDYTINFSDETQILKHVFDKNTSLEEKYPEYFL